MAIEAGKGVRLAIAAMLLTAGGPFVISAVGPAEAHKEKYKAKAWILVDKQADLAQGGIFDTKKKACANKRTGKLQARNASGKYKGIGSPRTGKNGNWVFNGLTKALSKRGFELDQPNLRIRIKFTSRKLGPFGKRHRHKCAKVKSTPAVVN